MRDENRVICQNCSTSYDKKFLLGKQGNVDTCPMCGASLESENSNDDFAHEESPIEDDQSVEKKTYYYYDDGSATLDIVLYSHIKPIYTFQATDMEDAERQLKEVCPNSPLFKTNPSSEIRCPRCFSTEYTLLHRGFSIFTGFLGSGRVKRVCNHCKKEF